MKNSEQISKVLLPPTCLLGLVLLTVLVVMLFVINCLIIWAEYPLLGALFAGAGAIAALLFPAWIRKQMRRRAAGHDSSPVRFRIRASSASERSEMFTYATVVLVCLLACEVLWTIVLTNVIATPSAQISACSTGAGVNEPGQVTGATHAQE